MTTNIFRWPDRPKESALAYVAETNHIDERLLPYRWYHELVVAGAEQHGLPPDYIAELRKQDWKEDPKPNRRTRLEAEKLLLVGPGAFAVQRLSKKINQGQSSQ
jgi:hypothetical protein